MKKTTSTKKTKTITIFGLVDRIKAHFTRYVNCPRDFPKMLVFMEEGLKNTDRRTLRVAFADEPYSRENKGISHFGSFVTITDMPKSFDVTVKAVNQMDCPEVKTTQFTFNKTDPAYTKGLIQVLYDAIVLYDMDDSEVDRFDGQLGGYEAYEVDWHKDQGMFKGLKSLKFTLDDED